MQFSPDGSKLAVGSDIGVWLYDVKTGKEVTPCSQVYVNPLLFHLMDDLLPMAVETSFIFGGRFM